MADGTQTSQLAAQTIKGHFETLFAQLPDSAILCRLLTDKSGSPVDGLCLAVNDAFLALTGREQEALVGQRWRELFPTANWKWIEEHLLPLGAAGSSDRFEIFSEALETYVELVAYVPSPGYLIMTVREIAQRKQAEAERSAALADLRERVKEATLLQKSGRLLAGTDEIPLSELVRLIPGAWQDPAQTAARIRVGGMEAATPNFPGGSTPRQQSAFSLSNGEQGTITVAYLGTATDPFLPEEQETLDTLARMLRAALEHQRATAALLASEERYRTLFETMGQGVAYFDATGNFLAMNPAGWRILGLTLDNLRNLDGETVARFTRDENDAPLTPANNPILQALQHGQEVKGQVLGVYNPQQEGWCWVEVDAIPQYRPGEARPYQVYAIFEDVTSSRAVASRLRLQAQLLESVDEGIVATDLALNVTYWSRLMEQIFAVRAADALGRPLAETFPLPVPTAQIEGALDETGSWRGELPVINGQEGIAWLAVTISPVTDEAGRRQGYIGVGRDITERRQREERMATLLQVAEALRGARRPADLYATTLEQVRALFKAGGVAIALADEQGVRVEAATAGWHRVVGVRMPADFGVTGRVMSTRASFASADMRGEGLFGQPELIPEGTAAVCVPLLAGETMLGVLWAERPTAFEQRELQLLEAVAGMVAGTLQRVSLFERVEAQALQMQRLMETVAEGLLLLDGKRRIVLANPAAEAYLDVLALETDDQGQWQTLGGRPLEALLAEPPRGAGAHELLAPGDPRRVFELLAQSLAPRAGNDERAQGWVVVLRDVTAERAARAQLQQQERLAAVGQLAAGIAHDFNNIMSAIVLYSELLQSSTALSKRDRRRMALIYDQAQEATTLVSQILDFGRRSVLERERLALDELLEEIIPLLRRTLPATIAVGWERQPGDYWLEGDAPRLKQVVLNLALNARAALPDGGSFTVTLAPCPVAADEQPPLPEMAPGLWACLQVSDDGQGIADADLPHIFEPFFTTRPPGEGNGLGLAQVYGIVHQHGGQIAVESTPGQGTTFTVYLPLQATAGREERRKAPPPAPRATPEAPAATILVVEDEPAVREALRASLEMLGYGVLTADDGDTALALFRERAEEIDLVLSDLVMARMGGGELHQALRALDPDLKVIIITGYPLADRGKALLEQGVVQWLQKPVSVTTLQERIAAALAA